MRKTLLVLLLGCQPVLTSDPKPDQDLVAQIALDLLGARGADIPPIHWFEGDVLNCRTLPGGITERVSPKEAYGWIQPSTGKCVGGMHRWPSHNIFLTWHSRMTHASQSVIVHELAHYLWKDHNHLGFAFASGGTVEWAMRELLKAFPEHNPDVSLYMAHTGANCSELKDE